MSQRYNDIIGGVHHNYFIYVSCMTKDELQNSLDEIRSNEKKSDLAYAVISVFLSIHHVQVGKSPYIVISGNTQENNKSNTFCY